MKQWKLVSIAALVSAVVSLNAFLSFYRSLDPVPGELQTHVGTVSELVVFTERFHQANIKFRLLKADGQSATFTYLRNSARFYELAQQMKNGLAAEVTVGPGGNTDLWGLKLGSQVLLTPDDARDDRRSDGYWSLAICLGFGLSALWSAREAASLRRRGA